MTLVASVIKNRFGFLSIMFLFFVLNPRSAVFGHKCGLDAFRRGGCISSTRDAPILNNLTKRNADLYLYILVFIFIYYTAQL